MRSEPIAAGRLSLLPFDERNLTANYVAWLNDPKVVRFSEQRFRVHDVEGCRSYWQSMQAAGNPLWSINVDGQHVGNISASYDRHNEVADIGILIGANSHGSGIGTQAWSTVSDWLLARGIRKLTAGAMATNAPMLRIFDKTGMHVEGVREAQFLWEGMGVDMVLVARFASGGGMSLGKRPRTREHNA